MASIWNYELSAVSKETTAGTAVIPSHFMKNVEIDLGYDPSYQDIEQINSTMFQGMTIKDKINAGGKISAFANSEDAGYLLSMAFGTPTTYTVATGVYSHVFDLKTKSFKSYTAEVSKGEYVERISGVGLDKFSIKNSNAAIMLDGTAKAQFTFAFATLTGNVSAGSGVTFNVDTTKNLVIGDILVFNSDNEEVTITSVIDETSFTADLVAPKVTGDYASLKKRTATYTVDANGNELEPLKFYGKSNIKLADTQGGLSSASQVTVQDISVDIDNGLQDVYGSGSYNAQELIQGLRKGTGKLTMTMSAGIAEQYNFFQDAYRYISFKAEGSRIGATAYYENLIFVAKIKFIKSPVSIKSGEIVKLNMDFKVVDAVSFTLQNAVASY